MSRSTRGSNVRLSPLTHGELGARRVGWQRRRARRRLALALLLVLAAAAVAAAVVVGGGSRTRARASVASLAPPYPSAHHFAALHDSPPDSYRGVDRALRYTSYVRVGTHRRRDVALTFDDGPGPYTSAIIRILQRSHTPATFFVIGRGIAPYRRLISVEAREGFDIGDHTWAHPFLSALPAAAAQQQILWAAHSIQAAGGPYPRLFRPPYGAFDAQTLAVLRAMRLLMVLWSADTRDYSRPGVNRIVYVALSGARPGGIILMHDGGGDRVETVDALPRIIGGLRRHGYHLVTVAQLVADDPPPRDQPAPRSLAGAG
jgi:peptidoglycan-N-acetylglucosamine deacetylase